VVPFLLALHLKARLVASLPARALAGPLHSRILPALLRIRMMRPVREAAIRICFFVSVYIFASVCPGAASDPGFVLLRAWGLRPIISKLLVFDPAYSFFWPITSQGFGIGLFPLSGGSFWNSVIVGFDVRPDSNWISAMLRTAFEGTG